MKAKIIVAILLILSVIGFGILIWVDHRDSVREKEKLEEISKQYDEYLNRLVSELNTIEEELKELDVDDPGDAGKGMSGYCILITEPRYEIITDIEPILSEYGIPGHICISESSFPEDEGNISIWRLEQLLESGWDLCLTVENGTDVNSLKQRLNDMELPVPSAAYLTDSSILPSLAESLRNSGIGTVFVRDIPDDPVGYPVKVVRSLVSGDADLGSSAGSCSETGEPFAVLFSPGEESEEDSINLLRNTLSALETLRADEGLRLYSISEIGNSAYNHYSEIRDALDQNIRHKEELLARKEEIQDMISSGMP